MEITVIFKQGAEQWAKTFQLNKFPLAKLTRILQLIQDETIDEIDHEPTPSDSSYDTMEKISDILYLSD